VARHVVSRFVLDSSCRLLDGGKALVGGSPLTLFRLSDKGAAVLTDLLDGRGVSDRAQPLTDRLLDAGVLHPRPVSGPYTAEDVTAVVPVHNQDPSATIDSLGPVGAVVVVDDASSVPIDVGGASVVRRPVNGGPGAARNTGLAAVATPLVAFVDADCQPQAGWLAPLLVQFADERVALVAPRVCTPAAPPAFALARYESVRSPLDLGTTEARVRARTRVAYVPSAAWVGRRDVVLGAGGFAEEMRVGEDVDLVWRLDEEGWRIRYEPLAVVHHAPRPTLRRWLRQRVAYGRSAAPLSARHAGATTPVAVSAWSGAVWLLAATGQPLVGGLVGLGTVEALARKLRGLDHPLAAAFRLAGLGHLHAGRLLANAITRAWWPVAVAAAVVSKRARRALVVAALAPALVDWWTTGPPLDVARYSALRILDDAAYGVGLWWGAVEHRTVEPLKPDLTSWPRPSRYDRHRRSRS
jgi:mycofactocin system glycosyltransferase